MLKYIKSLYYKYKERNYSPYCKNCDSCGHDGCCSYLSCVFNAMDKNKGCSYPETYKDELLIRDVFMEECLSNCESNGDVVNKFIDDMYDKACNEVYSKK